MKIFESCILFLSFIAFLCINLIIFPNFCGSQGGGGQTQTPVLRGGSVPPVPPQFNVWIQQISEQSFEIGNETIPGPAHSFVMTY